MYWNIIRFILVIMVYNVFSRDDVNILLLVYGFNELLIFVLKFVFCILVVIDIEF